MHKRVLVAEQNDTIRSVAEAVLRQNGFEVISVPDARKAMEILEFTLPHLVLVNTDLADDNGRLCYDQIQENPRTSSLPLLLLTAGERKDLPFPDEIIVRCPFDPADLIQRAMVFSGQSDAAPAPQTPAPAGEPSVDDSFLDAALGLDNLDVTESEVMDKTGHIRVPAKPTASDGVGFGHYEVKPEDLSDSRKVESLIIREEASEIRHNTGDQQPAKPKTSETSKLDIMSDQYGLSDPEAFKAANADEQLDHDYNWFISSMQEEANTDGGDPAARSQQSKSDSEELSFTEPSSQVDPITPGPSEKEPSSHSAGVDKFIDEFKKEIEQIRSTEPDAVAIEQQSMSADGTEENIVWEDKLEKITPEHMQLFTKEFITELADKIAVRIVSKIDADKLLQMIKAEIIARSRSKS